MFSPLKNRKFVTYHFDIINYQFFENIVGQVPVHEVLDKKLMPLNFGKFEEIRSIVLLQRLFVLLLIYLSCIVQRFFCFHRGLSRKVFFECPKIFKGFAPEPCSMYWERNSVKYSEGQAPHMTFDFYRGCCLESLYK